METKKIWVGSDFHLEGRLYSLPSDMPEAGLYDYIILAGDMAYSQGLTGPLSEFTELGAKVIYVPGNHEYWDGRPEYGFGPQNREMAKQCEALGVVFLNGAGNLQIPGTDYVVFGATWFSDFARLPEQDREEAYHVVSRGIGDYYYSYTSSGRKVTPEDHVRYCLDYQLSLDCLLAHCSQRGLIPIVVTHFAPSARSVHPAHPENDEYSAYFVTDWLDKNHERFPPGSIWVHGHTHWNVDYQLGNVRVMSNQYGYRGETCNQTYSPTKYFEVPVK